MTAIPPTAPPPAPRALRDALGMFATGVTIVTTLAPDGGPIGLTVNSFNSVSLEPPLVLWSLSHNAASLALFSEATHYVVNVLGVHQRELAVRFATRGPKRWDDVAWQPGHTGMPVLGGAIAVFECANRSRYPEGDHTILVGQVLHCGHSAHEAPLLYHGGMFYTEHPLGALPRGAAVKAVP
ncbi:flavin reductase family protein [Comamonas flocculans]|nr:flavin reductase family protein [Comamonas flocculans]